LEKRKAKETRPTGQLTDFRNGEIFPGFASLPKSGSVDADFYEVVDGTSQPLRHWCFLGEIADYNMLHHLELELTEVHNEKVPLHFYTDGRGSEVTPAMMEKGYTVALLYAQQRTFTYSAPGIRHEDPHKLKVCTTIPHNQAAFRVTDGTPPKDLPTPTKEAARIERTGPTVLAEGRWSQNVPLLREEGSLFKSMWEVLLVLVL
jgi:hypothetical protein